MRHISVFTLILFCLTACGGGGDEDDGNNRDGQPVWIRTEGYVDEHFYSVGVFGGNEDQTLTDRINGAQLDASNKMRSQLRDHAGVLLDNWSGTMVETSRVHMDNEIMNRSLARIVEECSEEGWQVEHWSDPSTQDNYVLLRLRFDKFVEIIKHHVSQLIAVELKDHSRRGHIELDREIETFRRRRIGG